MSKKLFDFVIGNPPYNLETIGDNEGYAPPVYNVFLDASYGVADKVEMIHPARFLFNAGSTPKSWNSKMLNDTHFKILNYEPNGTNIFSGADIKGGVVVSYRDFEKEYGPIGIFTPNEYLRTILNKVKNSADFQSMADIVVSRTAYRLSKKVHEDFPNAASQLSKGHLYDMSSNIFERLPQIFFDNKPDDSELYLKILGRENNERVYKYIKEEYVKKTINTDCYKVVLPKASGTGSFGEVISNPIVDGPGHGSTETFITIGAFNDEEPASAALKYISTKFARTMLGVLKRTQEITPDKWKYVPLQNFSSSSDIDWSKSIHEIDEQLYKKYDLSEAEINFIETNVKEME